MVNVILGIVGAIIFVIALVTGFYLKEEKGKFPAGYVAGAVFGIAVFFLANSIVVIPTGYTGVRTTFGQVDEIAVQNGFNWKIPFVQKIKKVNNKQQDIVFEGQIWSETSERTALYYDQITVTYQISPDKSAWIYANVSSYEDNLVTQSLVASAIKTSSKTLSSTDATNRGVIEPLALTNIQSALDEKYGDGVVIINKVVISDADFEDSYNEAIAQKQTAQLAYERQQIENQQKIEAAEADAKVKTTQAQAEAEAAVIKAQGEADANKLLNDSLTEKILQEMYLEKWDGALPKVTLSESSGTMFGIGDIIQEENDE